MKRFLKIRYVILLLLVVGGGIWVAIKPTNEANWAPDQRVLAYADIHNNFVTIHNIRNFSYKTETDFTPGYYDKTFDLNTITSVDFVVEPFSSFGGLAHTFLTFGFADGSHVAVSVEIRKKVGQSFSAFKSLFKQYELMYVIADENDVIKVRTNYRHDPVYLYPMKARKEQLQKLFLSMIERANGLKDHPEFYNLFNNTCTTNIVRHVNEIAPKEVPFSYKVLLPGYSDQLAYDLGLIDTNLPFQAARAHFLINSKALKYGADSDFSKKIRE